jgi:hypothetical protein
MSSQSQISVDNGHKRKSYKHTAHIRIKEYGVGINGDPFVCLQFFSSNGTKVRHWVSLSELASSRQAAIDAINRLGGHIVSKSARSELETRIQARKPKHTKIKVAEMVGWFGNNFVFPTEIIGPPTKNIVIAIPTSAQQFAQKYKRSGSLAGAKKLLRLARGNSRFMTAISLALVGPLGALIGDSQVAIQFVGSPGTGKSTLVSAVSSIWGWSADLSVANYKGFGESWNVTSNSLEQLAAGHCHTLLILDDTNTAPHRNGSRLQGMLDCIMRLDENKTKARLNSTDRPLWWTGIISTSNLSLDDMARSENVRLTNIHRDRMIDIFNPDGSDYIFETLHHHKTITSFAKELYELSASNHGIIAREFLHNLAKVKRENYADLVKIIELHKRKYIQSAEKKEGFDPRHVRLRQKLSTVYAAGCLAVRFGLVPWGYGELRRAVLKCEKSHLDQVSHHEVPNKSPIQILSDYILKTQDKFIDGRKSGAISMSDLDACGGLVHSYKGTEELILSERCFRSLFSSQFYYHQAKVKLANDNILKTDKSSTGQKRYVVKRPMGLDKNGYKARKYVVVVDISALKSHMASRRKGTS